MRRSSPPSTPHRASGNGARKALLLRRGALTPLALRCSLLTLVVASAAQAQDVGAQAPEPNVLLLVDTSGSMEYRTASDSFPTCDPASAGVSERSRWIELIEVLTGTISDYRCQAIERTSGTFATDFALPDGTFPIDYQYRNPYHQPLSGECTVGPNQSAVGADVFDWVEPLSYQYDSRSTACVSPFNQAGDGIIDAFLSDIRFGLMTFDTLPSAETGYSGTSAQYGNGVSGAWSYYWGAPASGKPAACPDMESMEVGARNAAALPWEGRMIPFGASQPSAVDHAQRNEHIEKVLLTSRPYGATPIAGILRDAHDFLRYDNSEELTAGYWGPQADPLVVGGCREQAVILLTDGEPNLDLRPHCEGAGPPSGVCPYDEPSTTASTLANLNPAVKTFVVGFAATTGGDGTDCKAMTAADLAPGGLCSSSTDKVVQVCCNLHRIAVEGGTQKAYFAEDKSALREALSEILGELTGDAGSRTRPAVHRGVGTTAAPASSYRLLSGYVPNAGLWSGRLERQRYACDSSFSPEPQAVDPAKGDDFVANVNSGVGAERQFYSVLGSALQSTRTIRPALSANPDGLGDQQGSLVSGNASTFASTLAASSAALAPDTSVASCSSLSGGQCAQRIVDWLVGLDNGTGEHRCPSPGTNCDLVGDIYHSSPRVVDRPDAVIDDETYDLFASTDPTSGRGERPMMLYTSSNDGFLHGFRLQAHNGQASDAVDSQKNNELWAFLPPAVLTSLQSQYPSVHQRLLDSEPVVKDVVALEDTGTYKFERQLSTAKSAGTEWRTILVQSFGSTRPGYFALDITDPEPSEGGPKFLWQLTTTANGDELFGDGGVPLITTVFIADGGVDKEVAVAVLPGGNGGAPTGAACTRGITSYTNTLPSTYAPRTQVNCYPADSTVSKSLTIVRLDNGEILRTFRKDVTGLVNSLSSSGMSAAASNLSSRAGAAVANLDSPITGRPVAFPSEVGAVADRVFVGDQDGTLWRVDLSEKDPEDWTMDLFFDTYAKHPDAGNPATVALAGQPIDTPPILSVDESGNVIVLVSSGDQEALAVGDTENYVWSLKETFGSSPFEVEVNWYTEYLDGKRVFGPMSLLQGALYYATFEPSDPTNACGGGVGWVNGVDFLKPGDAGDPSKGGEAVSGFPVGPIDGPVPGVTLMQQPSCADGQEDVSSPYLGYGTKTRQTNLTPGKIQLVFHTSDSSYQDSGTGNVGAGSIDVPSPPNVARIDSWAALVE